MVVGVMVTVDVSKLHLPKCVVHTLSSNLQSTQGRNYLLSTPISPFPLYKPQKLKYIGFIILVNTISRMLIDSVDDYLNFDKIGLVQTCLIRQVGN